jgi:hypothetical protein
VSLRPCRFTPRTRGVMGHRTTLDAVERRSIWASGRPRPYPTMATDSRADIKVCEITGLWTMTPCCLVDEYRRFEGTYYYSSSEKTPSTFYPENGGDFFFSEALIPMYSRISDLRFNAFPKASCTVSAS